jgi:gas vesicle structural protein
MSGTWLAALNGMISKRAPQASVGEVLDRVLDRGVVIDAWVRVSVAGLTLLDVDARVVVASIETYVQHSEAVATTPLASWPAPGPTARRARRRPNTAPPRPRRPVALRCDAGCTFRSAAKRPPTRMRCPSERGRTCPVATLAT